MLDDFHFLPAIPTNVMFLYNIFARFPNCKCQFNVIDKEQKFCWLSHLCIHVFDRFCWLLFVSNAQMLNCWSSFEKYKKTETKNNKKQTKTKQKQY